MTLDDLALQQVRIFGEFRWIMQILQATTVIRYDTIEEINVDSKAEYSLI